MDQLFIFWAGPVVKTTLACLLTLHGSSDMKAAWIHVDHCSCKQVYTMCCYMHVHTNEVNDQEHNSNHGSDDWVGVVALCIYWWEKMEERSPLCSN